MSDLHVWDALEVGPAVVEPRRIRVPYTIVRGEDRVTQLLTFRYADAVLRPDHREDQQLAALIGCQVALNYSLFCKRLVLHGPFDAVDRAWLRDMAANTAVEIFVQKLLAPNPFLLRDRLPSLEGIQRPTTWMGEVVFPDALEAPLRHPPMGVDPNRVAVLSSGGKDSLLTHGVCEELGLETHALFANESGRHWFSAANAWRHLERTRPARTARVWTDCDRLYTFALRNLPFIREDFAKVRADDYPIRLWSVAVFLFGCLPMVRARGAGRLFIGNEWDCTAPATTAGIDHYGGYFDQSRFFDEVLTKYFADKGFGLVQCSLLRPLSELLIEDVLSARYPELFALQMSCHAASANGDRMMPCGRCEKCRRIVGMLVALGRDPSAIGYRADVITRCLADLAARGVKQAEDGQHLAALLVDAGRIAADSPVGQQAQRHPETMRLRFDPLRSPLNAVPRDIRSGTWRIYLEHAMGAAHQVGAAWVEASPFSLPGAHQPHAHEVGSDDDAAEVLPAGQPGYLLGQLTWPQARRRFRETDVALLPVGAIEQHGLHLPLDIDSYDAAELCERVARACRLPRPLVLPLIPYGVSYHHEDFPGTISVGPATLAAMVHEVGMSAARNGIRKLLIVNGHGGNIPALQYAAQMINRDARIFTAVDTGETSDAEISSLIETTSDAHAGEYETSTALASRPSLVYLEHAQRDVPQFESRYLNFDSKVSVEWYVRTSRISKTGVLGDPTRATVEKGEKIWEIMVRNLVELVEHLQDVPLDALHEHGRRDI